MLTFKLFAICSLVLLVVWVVLGKTVRIPAFPFAGKTANIPAPRYASPARKDVWGLSAIHLVYLAVAVSGCLLLRQIMWFADRMSDMGIEPWQIGPFVTGVIYVVAAVAVVFLLFSLFFTVRRSAAWFTVVSHSALILCVCRLFCDWMAFMEDLEQARQVMTQYLFAYLGVVLAYTAIFWVCALIKKKAARGA